MKLFWRSLVALALTLPPASLHWKVTGPLLWAHGSSYGLELFIAGWLLVFAWTGMCAAWATRRN